MADILALLEELGEHLVNGEGLLPVLDGGTECARQAREQAGTAYPLVLFREWLKRVPEARSWLEQRLQSPVERKVICKEAPILEWCVPGKRFRGRIESSALGGKVILVREMLPDGRAGIVRQLNASCVAPEHADTLAALLPSLEGQSPFFWEGDSPDA